SAMLNISIKIRGLLYRFKDCASNDVGWLGRFPYGAPNCLISWGQSVPDSQHLHQSCLTPVIWRLDKSTSALSSDVMRLSSGRCVAIIGIDLQTAKLHEERSVGPPWTRPLPQRPPLSPMLPARSTAIAAPRFQCVR